MFGGPEGGIENIPFLQTNADAATMFATFWIEEISAPMKFQQLQYVQTVFLWGASRLAETSGCGN